jgi:hypothetical protein
VRIKHGQFVIDIDLKANLHHSFFFAANQYLSNKELVPGFIFVIQVPNTVPSGLRYPFQARPEPKEKQARQNGSCAFRASVKQH